MSHLRMVLAAKGTIALFLLALPMLFLPLEAFQLVGIPEYSAPSSFFIRLAGAMILTVATFQLWTCFDVSHKKGGVFGTLVECTVVLLVLWHYVFYGDMATWPVRGKILVALFGFMEFGFLIAILVTGYMAIFKSDDTDTTNATT